ncbi:hypothetical protein OESDEN_16144 [Oesophagostomum dentatum]|uniref:Uncharacterized protein n=1 Tax=Oesophagostomum dentatum TaxID=61180 RepID=A0A0B1SJW7_OESDE|nr:hypothetical protein OESDEN_16144 [Oesophagostomum dentatum]
MKNTLTIGSASNELLHVLNGRQQRTNLLLAVVQNWFQSATMSAKTTGG